MAISGHFFAYHIRIFHKTVVQTVIWTCSTCLNLNIIKKKTQTFSFPMFYKLLKQKAANLCHLNGYFKTISGLFSTNHIDVFHKTEVQKVILKCLTSLNPNWFKSYDTKRKNARNANECFCTKSPKIGNGNICSLCHNL